MDDLNLSDALQAVPRDTVEPEIRRDFMATLEAERFVDVVGESVERQEYVPLLDDDEKAAPKGSAPVAHSDSHPAPTPSTGPTPTAAPPPLGPASLLQGPQPTPSPAPTTGTHHWPRTHCCPAPSTAGPAPATIYSITGSAPLHCWSRLLPPEWKVKVPFPV
uniref:Uncharacterized protein n=1 Tax=Callorhinchus milii TaxID=7868 RepID=A0A4W3HLQ7_CALMI